MKYEGRYFGFGVLIGVLLFVFWDFVFNHYSNFQDWKNSIRIEEFRQDSEERLLNYIDGEWISSIGDVIVKVNIDKTQDFMVIEIEKESKTEKIYKIKEINKVNGLFGIVNLRICDMAKECDDINAIPIQFNKVFGMDKTITISYDSRLTYCVDTDDSCTRAFKRLK